MAKGPPHQYHVDMMNAFDQADRGTPRGPTGTARYEMASTGMPRSPAQMASVKKAARASATARGERAQQRSPKAGITAGSAATAPGPLQPPAGISTGGVSLLKKPRKGLLSL